MYIRRSRRRNGVHLSIIDAYWDPEIKNSRQITVKSLGTLEDLAKIHPDPEAYAQQVLEELEAEKAAATEYHHTVNLQEKHKKIGDGSDIPVYSDEIKNVGYGVLKRVYLDLRLDKFWAWKSRDWDANYSPDQIFRLLVFGRLLFPGSLAQIYEKRNWLFEPIDDFSPGEVCHCLELIAQNQDAIQEWTFRMSRSIAPGDLSLTYLYRTDFRFGTPRPGAGLPEDSGDAAERETGKEPGQEAVTGMALLTDQNGIPLGFDLIHGGESEKVSILNRLREVCPGARTILVADGGPGALDHLCPADAELLAESGGRCGYLFRETAVGQDEELRNWILDEQGYHTARIDRKKVPADLDEDPGGPDQGKRLKFIHKSRMAKCSVPVNPAAAGGTARQTPVVLDQKQVVYYSGQFARRQKRQRDALVARAADLIAHPEKYNRITAAGADAYVLNLSFDDRGNVLESAAMSLDEEKIREEARLDGYCVIRSSELRMSDWELRTACSGLNETARAFRGADRDFDACPASAQTGSRVDALFTVRYIALLILRLLQFRLQGRYPAERILQSLRSYVCDPISENLFKFPYYDGILESCEKALDLELDRVYLKRNEVRKLLRY